MLLLEQSIDMSKQKWEKEQAIYQQKNEFLDLTLREERQRYEEQRQQHEQMLRNLQMRERDSVIGKEEASKRIQEIKDKQMEEYRELEGRYETIRKRMQEQVDTLTERN